MPLEWQPPSTVNYSVNSSLCIMTEEIPYIKRKDKVENFIRQWETNNKENDNNKAEKRSEQSN